MPSLIEEEGEYDCRERKAEIYLCSTKIASLAYSFSDEYLPLCLVHWILVFVFEDGIVRCIEAHTDQNRIRPEYKEAFDPSWNLKEYKGSIVISPAEIRKLAALNMYNNTSYSLISSRTCHDWTVAVLKELGIPVRNLFTITAVIWASFMATLVGSLFMFFWFYGINYIPSLSIIMLF